MCENVIRYEIREFSIDYFLVFTFLLDGERYYRIKKQAYQTYDEAEATAERLLPVYQEQLDTGWIETGLEAGDCDWFKAC